MLVWKDLGLATSKDKKHRCRSLTASRLRLRRTVVQIGDIVVTITCIVLNLYRWLSYNITTCATQESRHWLSKRIVSGSIVKDVILLLPSIVITAKSQLALCLML